MSLDDHLCSDQDIRLLIGKCLQDLLIGIFRSRRIIIHTQYPRLWESLLHQSFDFLRSRLKSTEIFTAA